MKIIITGSEGMLGAYLKRYFELNEYDIIGWDILESTCSNTEKVDLCDHICVENLFRKENPDIIIHCAALINVDKCEEEKELALEVNTNATNNLALVARENGSKFIFISTDAVFHDPNRNHPFTETDDCNPINFYGKTKLYSEQFIQKTLTNYLILRTNIYGWTRGARQSFAEWILNSLNNGQKLNMFTDVIYSPIYVGHLAEIINLSINNDLIGIYHAVGKKSFSKFDFGIALAKEFQLDNSLILESSYKDFQYIAPRSGYMALDSKNLEKSLNYNCPTVSDGIKLFKKEKHYME